MNTRGGNSHGPQKGAAGHRARGVAQVLFLAGILIVLTLAVHPGILLAESADQDSPDHRPPSRVAGQMPIERFRSMPQDSAIIDYRVTTGNSIGLSFFSNGFLGNNLASRSASMEYPVGSDEEHLVRAGIWIGALASATGDIVDAETLVTTATLDGYYGSSGRDADSEFFPDSTAILARSRLLGDPFYHKSATSEQDLTCTYVDRHSHAAQTHRPLDIRVKQEILQWSYEPVDAIVVVNYHIINNHPVNPLFDLCVGLYGELASGWKAGHEEWPPSGWFRNKDIGYPDPTADTLHFVSEHHVTLDGGNCPSWAGYQLLGTRPFPLDELQVSFNWWDWDPSGANPETPVNDRDRYELLRNGAVDGTGGRESPNYDPVSLLSVGPLGTVPFDEGRHWIFESGDTITVSFAFIGGNPSPDEDPPRSAEEDLRFNAEWAQQLFDARFKIAMPPPSPRLYVENTHSHIRLWWDDLPMHAKDPKTGLEDFEGFRVYISDLGKTTGFNLLGEYDLLDSLFFNTGLDAITAPEPLVRISDEGDTLVYPFVFDIDNVRDGFKYWVAVTSFDMGTAEIDPLESGIAQNRSFTIPGPTDDETLEGRVTVFPNPYRGDAAWDELLVRDRYLWFAGLPERCKVRIFNLAGDQIRTIDFDANSYGATDVRGIYDPTDVYNPARDVPVLSGHMAAWDLTTRKDQAVATGLYLFSVEDLQTGEVERGKFLILK